MAKNDIEIYLQADGFYAGHMKKDGTLAAGAYKITGEDIMTMFTSFFLDYCKETGGQKLLMQDSTGALFVTMKVPTTPQTPSTVPEPAALDQRSLATIGAQEGSN